MIILLVASEAIAQEQTGEQIYQEYVYQLKNYNTSFNEYKIAIGEYKKFQTLHAREEAIEKTKTLLDKRAEVLKLYTLLIKNHFNSIESPQKSVYNKGLEESLIFLTSHQNQVKNASSLEDLSQVSFALESNYPSIEADSYRVLGIILSNQEALSAGKVTHLMINFKNYLLKVGQMDYQTDTADRWLLDAQAKLDFATKTLNQGIETILTIEPEVDDKSGLFEVGRSQIASGHQYLIESLTKLHEVVLKLKSLQ